jgi:hypothetical protein
MPFVARALAASCVAWFSLGVLQAHAQPGISPDQHKVCAATYTLLRDVIDDKAKTTVLFKRFFASMESYRQAVGLTREQTVERVNASTRPLIDAWSAGRLTRERAVADVQACDTLYGYPLFVPA